jgi:hypothetical protein
MAGKQPKSGAPGKRPTGLQLRVQLETAILAAAWNAVSEAQRLAWGERARTNRRGGRAARYHLRNGRRLFFRVNSRRLALGLPLFADPAELRSFVSAPLVKLVITNRAGQIALKLRVSGGEPQGVMVSSWRPCNPGVMIWRKFVRICPLPAPVREMSDITRPYVAKYGVPPVGKKVFVRIQQMRDYTGGLLQTTSAIVPDEEDWHGEQKAL